MAGLSQAFLSVAGLFFSPFSVLKMKKIWRLCFCDWKENSKIQSRKYHAVAILFNMQERKCGLPFHKVNYKKITVLAEAKGNNKKINVIIHWLTMNATKKVPI